MENIQKLPRSRDIAKSSWALFSKHWKDFVGVLAPMIVLITANNVISPYAITDKGEIGSTMMLSVVFVLTIALVVVSFWTSVVLMRAIASLQNGGSLNLERAKEKVWSLLFPMIGLGLIIGVLTMIGFLLLIIPGIIVVMMFYPAQYLLVLEGKKISECLKESREMTRGRKWNMFWTILWSNLLIMIPIWIVAIIAGYILKVIGSAVSPELGFGLFSAGEALALFMLMPLSICIGVSIYRALKK